MSYTYTTLDGWQYPPPPPAAGTYGLDIRQGNSGDCYFIAALIALAWSTPTLLFGQFETTPPPTSPPPRNHRYSFRPFGTPASSPFTTPETLAVDDTTHTLVFARRAPPNDVYIWSGIYEKAYAKYRQRGADPPAIEDLGQYNALWALNEVINATTRSMVTTGATFLSDIKTRGGIAAAGGKTTKPLVAWTYHDQASTPGGSYSWDDLIVANHTYAILGYLRQDSVDYIVLRNPYGYSTVTAGTAKTGFIECTPAWCTARFIDGNFALSVSQFPHYFEAVAYKA